MSDKFLSLFIDERKPIIKRTFSVNEEDYLLVHRVFNELGFAQYFSGFCYKVLADQLRAKGIEDSLDRMNHGPFVSVSSLLSQTKTALKKGLE